MAAPTDQKDIVSEILKRKLNEDLGRPVVVGNISAGSWGPPNMLAYIKRHGHFFDADVVVIVLSSHDYGDVPTFAPTVGVNPNFPDHRPMLALQELVSRYLWPRLMGAAVNPSVPAETLPSEKEIDESLAAVRELILRARSAGATVFVAQHLEAGEQGDGTRTNLLPGHDLIAKAARESGATVIQLGPAEWASLKAGKNPYRDNIHPNPIGQHVMANVLLEPIEKALRAHEATTLPAP